MRGDAALAFLDNQDLVGADVREPIDGAAGPLNFDQVGLLVFSQAEVQAHVVSREEISTGANTVVLDKVACDYLHPSADSVPVALGTHGLDL